MTTNEEAQKELVRLVEMLCAVAKEMPVTLWETKTPFLRALDKCIDGLRHPFSIEKHIELHSEVNILSAYVEFCRAQSATLARIPPTADPGDSPPPGRLARIPPTSGDTGPRGPYSGVPMKSENGKTLLAVNFETCATGKFCLEGPIPCEHLSALYARGNERQIFECMAFGNAPLECVSVTRQRLPVRCKACIQAECLADQTMGPGES